MKLDLRQEIKNAKEVYEEDTRVERVIASFNKIMFDNLTSTEQRLQDFIVDADDGDYFRIKSKSNRYQFLIEKEIYHRFGKDFTRFTLVALDNIDIRNDYNLVYIEFENEDTFTLDNFISEREIRLYELLLNEYNKK